jgi:hypothetical protein
LSLLSALNGLNTFRNIDHTITLIHEFYFDKPLYKPYLIQI